MTWIILTLFLEFNYFPQQMVFLYQYNDTQYDYSNTYGATFGADLELFDKWIFIEGKSWAGFLNKRGRYDFSPNYQYYAIGAGINIKDILKIGWEHTCFHPILVYYPTYDFDDVTQFAEGGYERFYVRVETKLKIGG